MGKCYQQRIERHAENNQAFFKISRSKFLRRRDVKHSIMVDRFSE
jgi:hypothetical protein